MRAGVCTVQQALTAEAATVVKQAVALARRRGHAQVTPLHVANTMLSSPTGLLRTACLQSHSHPLQCKALELCFNVALNRLPASSSSPILGPQSHHYPSISNALVAAFKRAQAHQRRGSIENQQQPLLAVKIELEQLIISILDDPSVSRVMREAGFSSTQVKSNVEQAVALELCSQSQTHTKNPPSSSNKSEKDNLLVLAKSSEGGINFSKPRVSDHQVKDEDVSTIVERLVSKRRKNLVIVGECISSLEGIVGALMDKVDRGDIPEDLREVKFISVPLHSFAHLHREDVEKRIADLTCLVKSLLSKGVVLCLGDLKWITEYRANSSSSQVRSYYCPVEHIVLEIGRLACGVGENGRYWLLGTATFQTYMRCRNGPNSLEMIWALHPVTIAAGDLGLSLISESETRTQLRTRAADNGSPQHLLDQNGEEKQLTCCADCAAKYAVEAQSLKNSDSNSNSTMTSLPSWLRDERKRLNSNDQNCFTIKELCEKWNSICSSVHKRGMSSERPLNLSSTSPSSSNSCFSYDQQYPNLPHNHFQVTKANAQQWKGPHLWDSSIPSAGQTFSDNPNSTPHSASSSDIVETEYVQRFKEFNAENFNTLCNALEQKVPWQKETIPEIVGTILQCRSGMIRRKEMASAEIKEETWLFFQGIDVHAKEKIAKELAKLIFGSYSSLEFIALSSFSSTRADSTEDLRNKRSRDEQSCSYLERFAQAVSSNPHRVFVVEDVEQADYYSQMGIKRAIERGKIRNSNGEEVSLGDAVIILSCENFSSRSRACSPAVKQRSDGSSDDHQGTIRGNVMEEESPFTCFDLNISFCDDSADQDQSIDDIGLLEKVDKQIVLKLQEL